MIRLRRHSAFVLLAALLIGGLPVLHSAQHVAEHARAEAPAEAPSEGAYAGGAFDAAASGAGDASATHAAAMEQAECDLCAHTLYGTPSATQLPAAEHEAISEKTRLRSRVVQATPYHFVIRGPPAHA